MNLQYVEYAIFCFGIVCEWLYLVFSHMGFSTQTTNLLMFVCGAVGLTYVAVESSVAEGFRDSFRNVYAPWLKGRFPFFFPANFEEAIDCHLCFGFWSGIVVAPFTLTWNPLLIFICGFASAGLSYAFATTINYLEAQSVLASKDEV